MATSVQCEKCHAPVAEDAPAGLCPNCLLRTAIEHGASRALAPFLPRLNYFGDYELLEEVARGGMGVVYRARQVSLDRTVAVKMMRPGLLATDAEIARFQKEAKTAAGLQHPNIVAIHEVGKFDGLHYFSMDFVEGPDLAALVRERPLSSPECARYVQVLAETIEYAHARGVLHRDLKPSNVLVDAAGRPRITDFGLARHLEQAVESESAGSVVGTPAYMPPEQASGREDQVGATADVYSLGAILYELLTGQAPFRAATQAETVRMVLEDQPLAPRRLNPEVSAELEKICLRCLEKDPAKRYESASELAAALAGLTSNAAPPVHGRWKVQFAAAAGAVLFALVLWLVLKTDRAVVIRQTHVPATAPLVEEAHVRIAPPGSLPRVAWPSLANVLPGASVSLPPAPSPSLGIRVSPDSGSGFSQAFAIRYANASQVELDIHDSGTTAIRHCDVLIDTASGQVQLQFFPDRGPGIRVAGTLGSLSRPDNAVCALDLSKASMAAGEVSLPIVFKPGFEGPKEVDSARMNSQGVRLEKGITGRWLVGQ